MTHPSPAGWNSSTPAGHGLRLWLAVILSFLAILGITLSTPAHALEQVMPEPHAVYAVIDHPPAGHKAQAPTSADKSQGMAGHVCATHCAAHMVTEPPIAQALGQPPALDASWPPARLAPPLSNRIFALERPPRA